MRIRAKTSGVHLSSFDASLVKGMLDRGDRQHDIAAWFGVNGGRVAEIATGQTFEHVGKATPEELPPSGPYPSARETAVALAALEQADLAISNAKSLLQG